MYFVKYIFLMCEVLDTIISPLVFKKWLFPLVKNLNGWVIKIFKFQH